MTNSAATRSNNSDSCEQGAEKKFVKATTKIEGETVVVTAPVAVRFGWNHIAEPNLSNGADLPASPFRTDDWTDATNAPELFALVPYTRRSAGGRFVLLVSSSRSEAPASERTARRLRTPVFLSAQINLTRRRKGAKLKMTMRFKTCSRSRETSSSQGILTNSVTEISLAS
jgi:hypothetical protein